MAHMLTSDQHLSTLRRRIAAGEYYVNARNVAGSIVEKLREINRARRALNELEDGRSPRRTESTRRARGSRRPPPERSSR
jgi:hypothetical protein